MGHGQGKSCSSYEKAPVPVADYNVTGELTPDATCNYFQAGTFNGKPYYRREDGAWHIWFLPIVPRWYISIELGTVGLAFWYRDSVNVEGIYQPEEDASGIATVSAGPH